MCVTSFLSLFLIIIQVAREEARGMADRARLRKERAHATKLNRARGEKIRTKRADELRTSQEMKKTKTDNMLEEKRVKNESKREETRKANVARHKRAQAELDNLAKAGNKTAPTSTVNQKSKSLNKHKKQITESTLPRLPPICSKSPSSIGTSSVSSKHINRHDESSQHGYTDKDKESATQYDGDDSRVSQEGASSSRKSKRVEWSDEVSDLESNDYLRSDNSPKFEYALHFDIENNQDIESDSEEEEEEAFPMELPSPSVPSFVRDAETGEMLQVGGSSWQPWSDLYPMITPPEAKQLAILEAEKRRAEYIKELELEALEIERKKQEALDKLAKREAKRQRRLERKRARLPPVDAPRFASLDEGKLVLVPKVSLGLDLVEYKFRVHGHTLDKMVNSRDVDGRNVLNMDHYATKQMVILVKQRDKYQAHILSLLLEEQSEEKRRELEIKAASVNESALAWVKKRHKMERHESRIRIERINHDNELSLMSRMCKYDM